MTIARELYRLAGVLAETGNALPGAGHVGRNRAASTAYYAVFHGLARMCAEKIAGKRRPSLYAKDAYQHVYRSLEHRRAKTVLKACSERRDASAEMRLLAAVFADLQARRERADYDPYFYIRNFEMQTILADANSALDAIDKLGTPERQLLVAQLIGRTRA